MIDIVKRITQGFNPYTDPDNLYVGHSPSLAFNSTAMAFFGVFTLYHIGTGLYYKSWWFSSTIVLFTVGQLIGYLGRVLAANDIWGGSLENANYYLLQFCALIISANLLNAAMYYQYSKMIELYGSHFSTNLHPLLVAVLFMISDLVCLVVQAIGGAYCGEALTDHTSMKSGENIFIAGLAMQVFSMAAFQILFLKLCYILFIETRLKYLTTYQRDLEIEDDQIVKYRKWTNWYKLCKLVPAQDLEVFYHERHSEIRLRSDKNRWKLTWYPVAVFVSFFCAFIRCIYRLVELAEGGFDSYIITHEYFLVFLDFLPLTISLIIISTVHPGAALLSKYYDLPVKKTAWFGKNKRKRSKSIVDENMTDNSDRYDTLEKNEYQGDDNGIININNINDHENEVELNHTYFNDTNNVQQDLVN